MKISVKKAKKDKLFYFVATTQIYQSDLRKCLILKRSQNEITHPGKWTVVGGKLEYEDLKPELIIMHDDVPNWENEVKSLLKREALEEANLKIDDFHYLGDTVFVRPDNVPVVCLKMAARYIDGELKFSEDFEDAKWVDGEEVNNYDCITGIKEDFKATINIFQ